ncbi:MAG: cation:proton antiporter [Candidatus Manganitrophus sp.]|nr:cation:proton antiporter [Candidatus Manganitrophus sp.]WDT69376.1 MAG: cation:proton antiporter [Candidatus Manganitrophus sp.]
MDGFSHATLTAMLALVGAVIIIAALLSGLIERSGLPQVAAFLALGAVLGPGGLNLFDVRLGSPLLQIVATLSLVLVLFTDAVSLNLKEVRRHLNLALLVLGPGTLLSALLIAYAAWRLLDLPFAAAAILGAALASTDPVLLRGVLKGEFLPAPVRQALRLESGLNDAVLLPVVLIGMVFLGDRSLAVSDWGSFGLSLFLLGPGVGMAVGFLAVSALVMMRNRFGVRRDYESIYSLGVVFAAYAGAEAVHGSGFLAAFAAGMTIAALDVELCDCFLEYGETTAEMTLLFTFILFGTSLIWSGFTVLDGRILVFAALTILIRPIAFLSSLAGFRLAWKDRLMIAWFGPRGLSSLLLILLPVFAGLPGGDRLFSVTCAVVLLSIVLHGGSLMWLGKGARPSRAPQAVIEPIPPAPPPSAGLEEQPGRDLISIAEMRQIQETGAPVVILDARTERSYQGNNENAVGTIRFLPEQAVGPQAKALGLPREALLIPFCACPNDETSIRVAQELRQAGWPRARALEGGWEAWKKSGLPTVERK